MKSASLVVCCLLVLSATLGAAQPQQDQSPLPQVSTPKVSFNGIWNLEAVSIRVQVLPTPQVLPTTSQEESRPGVTEEDLETALREAVIQSGTVSIVDEAPNVPRLALTVHLWPINDQDLVYTQELSLHQTVYLYHTHDMWPWQPIFTPVPGAVTWRAWSMGRTTVDDGARVASTVLIEDLVGLFADNYFRENPASQLAATVPEPSERD